MSAFIENVTKALKYMSVYYQNENTHLKHFCSDTVLISLNYCIYDISIGNFACIDFIGVIV